ncbi:cholesterol 7-desaturase-like [Stegodyphus dumicola]|uniref:cholesterol 7-desaturase-like n=1 Tax=Stegodyphus dumicola TaxID=202533 RepID=UPI0015A8F295|nr:cholesterol 7-desaturase-like [Stegodyphus dumicola]XP_035229634.1 cholesterol 7-desaturase-like [Stegodyphus dumicola]XP_035229696.1 cholesterol 7-desaturase-like [Stegodyphus dumicola]XP_035229765.1 cholesterol 7-desaturase-like [Stegodyphus dumicola]XP_035229826.1 cholesterol 7-desaturase-like [Stegodyphus dumicola]
MFLTMIVVRYHWSMPLDIKRNVNSGKYNHLKCPMVRYKNIERIIHNRVDQGNSEFMPPVYTNGWIPIVESRSLNKGALIPVEALGQRFCVYRSEEGKAHIIDPYCPHLGADLSVGGCVVGENIQCPFHGWQFSGKDGVCRKIPYANKVPDIAKTKVWPTRERNGYIFVWYHAEDCSPDWEMPSIPDVEEGRWIFRGRTEHEAKCHIQEIPENGADVAHLHHLHSPSVFLGSKNTTESAFSLWSLVANVWHEWEPIWEPDDERRHVARMQLKQRTCIGRFNVPFSSLKMNIEQIGPATVHMHMETFFGKAVLLQHITPLAPFRQKIVHLLYTEPSFKQFPADLFILAEAVMLERDIEIWNNKKFLKYPIILKEDTFIRKYRRWYSQFYSANSPKLQDVKQSLLDW